MSASSLSFSVAASHLIASFVQASPIYANSLILTVYGDTICPHGGSIWLGSLIKLVEPLGINQRLVRTSVFRLSEKNILQSKQVGRRSYYSLTDRGFRQFSSADKRIYTTRLQPWDGQWRLVLTSLGSLDTEQREAVRKELFWLGFTHVTTGVFAHPTADLATVKQLVEEMQISKHIVMLQAQAVDPDHLPLANTLIKNCFNVQAFDEEYQTFCDAFQPVLNAAAASTSPLDPALSFLVRTLLIHQYRRILLREPELPHELTQSDSLSQQARRLTARLYKLLAAPADKHFTLISENEQGQFDSPQKTYYQRFNT